MTLEELEQMEELFIAYLKWEELNAAQKGELRMAELSETPIGRGRSKPNTR